MTTTTGAGTDQDDTDQGQGAAPPAGESQGDKDKAPGDDWVPKKQFIAAINNATAKADQALARAEAAERELTALREKGSEKKPPTRAELLALVNSGDLTQEQADALWEKQIVERSKREAAAEVGQTMTANERARRVDAELSGYKELVPEVWADGTPERAKVTKEFNYLVGLGHPSTKETEAAALRAAFGDLESLRASKSARPGPADTHSETGGGRPGASGGGKSDVLKDLSPDRKNYYEAQIKAGRYKNWGEVRSELEFRPKHRA